MATSNEASLIAAINSQLTDVHNLLLKRQGVKGGVSKREVLAMVEISMVNLFTNLQLGTADEAHSKLELIDNEDALAKFQDGDPTNLKGFKTNIFSQNQHEIDSAVPIDVNANPAVDLASEAEILVLDSSENNSQFVDVKEFHKLKQEFSNLQSSLDWIKNKVEISHNYRRNQQFSSNYRSDARRGSYPNGNYSNHRNDRPDNRRNYQRGNYYSRNNNHTQNTQNRNTTDRHANYSQENQHRYNYQLASNPVNFQQRNYQHNYRSQQSQPQTDDHYQASNPNNFQQRNYQSNYPPQQIQQQTGVSYAAPQQVYYSQGDSNSRAMDFLNHQTYYLNPV